MKTLALVNNKGGVDKTRSAVTRLRKTAAKAERPPLWVIVRALSYQHPLAKLPNLQR